MTAPTTFRQLHASGCFVLPNPWDAGSAKILASLGFSALATTSAGLAFSLGRVDSPASLGRDLTLANVRAIVRATPLPVNADFQAGYGSDAEAVYESVAACVATGVAGLSIEDASEREDESLYELPVALERLAAARRAIEDSDSDIVLTARAESFLVGHPRPLADALERLIAYAEAGADCVYAPGLRTREDIAAVVAAVSPTPVNVLLTDPSWMTVTALEDLGVRRISVGSALARAAWAGFLSAATEIARDQSFGELAGATPFSTLDDYFE